MCGITGIVNHHDAGKAAALITGMTAALAHRGPDGDGRFVDADVALGHRRLAIVDPAGGKQPFVSEDGRVVAIVNGEIYNHLELREQLVSRGHVFKTDCDAEVVVHLYEELGGEFVRLLDGMFALAVYNSGSRRVLLARDRLGQKPLLYFMRGSTLVFGSEFAALEAYPDMPRELDMRSVAHYFSLHSVPSPDTIYRDVHKLPPAHQLEFRLEDNTVSIRCYWKPDYSIKAEISFADAAVELRGLVENAVMKRLMADVPLGVFLSGGIDSCIVAGIAAKLSDGPLSAFTVGFKDGRYDERRFAALSAAAIDRLSPGMLEHKSTLVDPGDFSLLEKLSSHAGEPFADASILPTALLSRFAAASVKVALSGDGADEVFMGYDRYRAMRIAAGFDLLPRSLRGGFAAAAHVLPDHGERSFGGRVRRFADLLGEVPADRYFRVLDRCPEPLGELLFGERLRGAAEVDPAGFFTGCEWELSAPDPRERLAELDLHTYLANDVLTKVDLASMSESLEVRSPFLDREVVEFAAKLPGCYKFAGGRGKRILREAFRDLFPSAVASRSKRGFGVPVAAWLRGAWRGEVEARLFDGAALKDGCFQEKMLRRLWLNHQNRRYDNSYLLWGVLNFALFYQRVFGRR
ncbi:MAG: asparagine synthase (glutamine-hydrolyzing) [Victivallaceae bacterium]|nr:asparagine synthase (glutamine-hydrolyzing) [Victivallaceae bacterium]